MALSVRVVVELAALRVELAERAQQYGFKHQIARQRGRAVAGVGATQQRDPGDCMVALLGEHFPRVL